ncbi:response regulator [Shewanella woodyi]|uniref:Response regulator receiver modulated metal dependent phosphohydrolase n=1 Tax=Shewanella woodyi (strain ATCC 51908 / MS32) TaxID=392500 RepID=B1KFZ8_SHEWM|nr:response regulator [Shewanella woodyi]ACA86705.1 response regulator receiver modulated metal dependent phosphohydrolase [Shewanella woodyi ATCC 51908]
MLIDIAKKSPLFSGKKKAPQANSGPAWKILIVDDEPDVHTVTKLALSRFKLDNRTLEFINAYSGEEAKQILLKEKNIAMAFVDVVMESDHAGLELVRWIREDHVNKAIRLILRTGQPGQAPEEDVIVNYDINDYKAKAELDSRKLVTSVYSALRSYRDIMQIEEAKESQIRHRKGLERVVQATSGLFELRTLHNFADGLLTQVATLLNFDSETLLFSCSSVDAMSEQVSANKLRVLAGTGQYSSHHDKEIPENIKEKLLQALKEKNCIYEKDCFVGYFPAKSGWVNLMYMGGINSIDDLDKKLIDIFAINVGVAFENLLLNKELEDTQSELILRLGDVVESRSKEAANHVKRMAAYCFKLALIAGLDVQDAELIKHASPMHDIGKIATPDSILLKPGKLDAAEWSVMRQHPQVGHDILARSERPILKAASIISLQHHEKFDGSGYPSGLKGEDIHIFARIVAIADVFDALSHARCYKPAWPLEEVMKAMKEGSGSHFDPVLLDLFIENIEVFNMLKEKLHD